MFSNYFVYIWLVVVVVVVCVLFFSLFPKFTLSIFIVGSSLSRHSMHILVSVCFRWLFAVLLSHSSHVVCCCFFSNSHPNTESLQSPMHVYIPFVHFSSFWLSNDRECAGVTTQFGTCSQNATHKKNRRKRNDREITKKKTTTTTTTHTLTYSSI